MTVKLDKIPRFAYNDNHVSNVDANIINLVIIETNICVFTYIYILLHMQKQYTLFHPVYKEFLQLLHVTKTCSK